MSKRSHDVLGHKVDPPFHESVWEFEEGHEPSGWECTAKSKQRGYRCEQHIVPGTDKCHYHGGKRTTIKHGLKSKYGPPEHLRARIEAYENDPKILEHKRIAATLMALLDDLLSTVEEGQSAEPDQIEPMIPVLRELQKTATNFHRLALDTRFVDLVEAGPLIAQWVQRILRFVPESKRPDALAELEVIVGDAAYGGAEPAGTPSVH